MRTYYIIEKNGYRRGVKGRAVQVHKDFKTFYMVEKDRYIVRDQASGFIFAEGMHLFEARLAAADFIRLLGVEEISMRINKILMESGPRKGG